MFLIIGCGYIGERVCDILHARGHEVIGATHSAESAHHLRLTKPYPVHQLDITNPDLDQRPWPQVKDKITSVLHCASTNRGGPERAQQVYQQGSENLSHLFPNIRRHFVSSTSLYTQTDGSLVTEETSTEDASSVTAQALLTAEKFALDSGGFAARLGGIYGPERSFILKNFLEGKSTIEGNEGEGRLINQIHREDAANALVFLLLGACQGIYNVVDDHPMTQRECFSILAERFHFPIPPLSPPNHQRKRAFTHKRISNTKLRSLHWQPLYPSYLDALKNDPLLVPSILAQVASPAHPLSGHDI